MEETVPRFKHTERLISDSIRHFIYGAIAGVMETMICHPLDTIKTRYQNNNDPFSMKYGIRGFYRGVFTVINGVIPKMGVRFASFEYFRYLTDGNIALSGLCSGFVEAVLVVNPIDVIKIRMQTHSMKEPGSTELTVWNIIQSEKWRLFYRGVYFTMLRQGMNQCTNFFMYHHLRRHYEMNSAAAAFISSGIGPILNNPIDVIKTRLHASSTNRSWIVVTKDIWSNQGVFGFYRGLTPRLIRIMPGQAITFTVYEYLISKWS